MRTRQHETLCKLEAVCATFPESDPAVRAVAPSIRAKLNEAERIASKRIGFRDWLTGESVERAWSSNLHPAEEELCWLALSKSWDGRNLAERAAAALDVCEHAERHGIGNSSAGLVRLKEFRVAALGAIATEAPCDDKRVVRSYDDIALTMSNILRAAHRCNDDSYREVRTLRNRLMLLVVLLLISTAAIIGMQIRSADYLLVGLPEGAAEAGLSAREWPLLIATFGALGGLWSTVMLWRRLPRDRSPYNLPLQQGMVKIFAGAFVAVVGLMMIDGGVFGGVVLETVPTVLAVALILGYSQELLTRFLDGRAKNVLNPDPGDSCHPNQQWEHP